MSIEAIGSLTATTPLQQMSNGVGTPKTDFADWMARETTALNAQLQNADALVQQLATGDNSNLHQVMLNLERAKLSFELVVQVRNKLLEGYQEVMRMQI